MRQILLIDRTYQLVDLTPSLARLIDRIAKLEELITPGEVMFHLQRVKEEDELPVTDSDIYQKSP